MMSIDKTEKNSHFPVQILKIVTNVHGSLHCEGILCEQLADKAASVFQQPLNNHFFFLSLDLLISLAPKPAQNTPAQNTGENDRPRETRRPGPSELDKSFAKKLN